jgi:hypothetical protein
LCNALGKANSAAIAAVTDPALGGPHPAASYCEGLTESGYTDWYLPALPELNVLYTNRAEIGGFDTTSTYYWSASELNTSYAWILRLGDGNQTNGGKNSAKVVRCVRR